MVEKLDGGSGLGRSGRAAQSGPVKLIDPFTVRAPGGKQLGQPVGDVWKEGAEHEVTFIYSACGCPVKVMCRRAGDRTVRTKDLPVIFPDDPAVVTLISQLMKW